MDPAVAISFHLLFPHPPYPSQPVKGGAAAAGAQSPCNRNWIMTCGPLLPTSPPHPNNKGSLIEIRRALPTALDPNVPFRISLDPNVSSRNTEAPSPPSPSPSHLLPFPPFPFPLFSFLLLPFLLFSFCLFSFSPFAFSPFLLLPWGVLTGSAHSMTQCVYVCREKERERERLSSKERGIELKGWGGKKVPRFCLPPTRFI